MLCKCCSKKLSEQQMKFCSRSCAARINNQGVRRHGTGKYAKKKCFHCNTETTNAKYCSHKCQKAHEWDDFKVQVESTGEIKSTLHGQRAKRYLIEINGHQCEICDREEWNDQPIPIILDHIDGNSSNWKVKNLRLICPNCDAQTPTFKAKNKGNGRHYRRDRYREGKSY